MDPNTYEMESPLTQHTNYQDVSNSPITPFSFGIPGTQVSTFQFQQPSSSLTAAPMMPPLPQEHRHPYRKGDEVNCTTDPHCLFRSGVIDDCSKARFYLRTLEFYLLEHHHSAPFHCPMATCPEWFANARDMLVHLKICKRFSDGVFWCSPCRRYEEFRTQSGRRCSWDKEWLGQKLLQKSKDALRDLTGNFPETPQVYKCGLCVRCNASLQTPWVPNCGHSVQTFELITESTKPFELVTESSPVELAGSPMTSKTGSTQHQEALEYSHQESISEPSPVSSGSNGSPTNASVSPTSSTHVEQHSTAYAPHLVNLASGTDGFLAESYKELQTINSVRNRRRSNRTSFRGSVLYSHPTIPPTPPMNPLSVASISPPVLASAIAQHSSYYNMPEVTREIQAGEFMASMPFSATPSIRPYSPEDYPSTAPPSFEAYSTSPQEPDQPVPDTLPHPRSPPPTYKAVCPECGFEPTGKPESLKAYLRKHRKTHRRVSLPCDFCNKFFTRQDNRSSHMRRKHPRLGLFSPKRHTVASGSSSS
ncbi:putative zinc finger C2H2-like protein [Rosellinia necatrix]|uniref:Putative zinc finger C2H2-like protein n=1 Tax=Rosellinia necatrix TaxID=77044 RepID=A0A1W2TJ66_ROSNE|nr:putative zinc finger C2H2-like protein [Rosellinia necatrix]